MKQHKKKYNKHTHTKHHKENTKEHKAIQRTIKKKMKKKCVYTYNRTKRNKTKQINKNVLNQQKSTRDKKG